MSKVSDSICVCVVNTNNSDNLVYTANVNFSNSITISSYDYMHDSNIVIDHVLYKAKQSIIETVFGEFKPILQQLNTALNDNDIILAKEYLTKLNNEMFIV